MIYSFKLLKTYKNLYSNTSARKKRANTRYPILCLPWHICCFWIHGYVYFFGNSRLFTRYHSPVKSEGRGDTCLSPHFFARLKFSKFTNVISYKFKSKTAILSHLEGINFKFFSTVPTGTVKCLKSLDLLTFEIYVRALCQSLQIFIGGHIGFRDSEISPFCFRDSEIL